MKIVNGETKEEWDDVVLFLTLDEAKELRDSLEQLIKEKINRGRHEHISSADYKKEITVVINSAL